MVFYPLPSIDRDRLNQRPGSIKPEPKGVVNPFFCVFLTIWPVFEQRAAENDDFLFNSEKKRGESGAAGGFGKLPLTPTHSYCYGECSALRSLEWCSFRVSAER